MPSVLLVEDEAPLRRILTLNLVKRGYSVAEADSVASAQEMIAAAVKPFAAILLDINLPDGSGWDLLRGLEWHELVTHPERKSLETRPRVILLTAVRPISRRVDEFQPDGILLKPFPISALFVTLERVLKRNLLASGTGR